MKRPSWCMIVAPEDVPSIIISLICALLFLVYGASAASLGPAVPSLAIHYNKSISEMGAAFTCRGMGFLSGTLLSPFILMIKNMPISKETIPAVCIILSGLTLLFIDLSSRYEISLILYIIQGVSFGILETVVLTWNLGKTRSAVDANSSSMLWTWWNHWFFSYWRIGLFRWL